MMRLSKKLLGLTLGAMFKRNGKDYVFIMESVPDGKFIYNIAAITLPVDGYAKLIMQSINSFRW